MRVYLVIGADRSVRVAKRPRLALNEVAVEVNLRFPDTWGSIISTASVNVPDFAPTVENGDDGGEDGTR